MRDFFVWILYLRSCKPGVFYLGGLTHMSNCELTLYGDVTSSKYICLSEDILPHPSLGDKIFFLIFFLFLSEDSFLMMGKQIVLGK